MREAPPEKRTEEIGDLLFACANLARQYKIDPEEALRQANRKFERRFRAVEAQIPEGGATLDEMEAMWQGVKAKE